MKAIFTTLALAATVLLVACSENRRDPLASLVTINEFGGILTTGSDRANKIVTWNERLNLCNPVLEQIRDTYLAAVQATALSGNSEAIRILGNYGGNAIVTPIPLNPDLDTVIVNLISDPTATINVHTIVFNNFSNSGNLFLGGTVWFVGGWKDLGNDTTRFALKLKLRQGLAFAGDYAGSIEFNTFLMKIETNMIIPFPNSVTIRGRVTIRSGDEHYKFSPYLIYNNQPAAPGLQSRPYAH